MHLRVKLFAVLRDLAGTGELSLEARDGTTAGEIVEQVGGRFEGVRKYLPRVAVAVNQEYAGRETPLRDGDEVALIPPVSGG